VLTHRRGHLCSLYAQTINAVGRTAGASRLDVMTPHVATEDLVDARDVAEILGLSHPSAVSVYQHRYEDMPRPVLDLGRGRAKLWLRTEVERWSADLASAGRTRPKRRVIR
jgi:predicted DNA-binding transcriptional regulator AlpA